MEDLCPFYRPMPSPSSRAKASLLLDHGRLPLMWVLLGKVFPSVTVSHPMRTCRRAHGPPAARPIPQPQSLLWLFAFMQVVPRYAAHSPSLRASNESGFLISTSTMNCCCGQWNFVKPTIQPSLRKHNSFSQGTDRGHPSRRRPRRSRVFLSSYRKHSNSRFSHADYSGVLHYLRLPD
jgi:hypothetical protein